MDQNASTPLDPLSASRQNLPYKPIRDYAIIGDCHGSALIARDGSIDWCCLARFDAEPVLWRLLDAQQGSFFQINPTVSAQVDRAYIPGTNILRTHFTVERGQASVIDFMPVGRVPGTATSDDIKLNAPGWLVRIAEGIQGSVTLRALYQPASSRFADDPSAGAIQNEAEHCNISLYDDSGSAGAGTVDLTFTLKAGERRIFVLAPTTHAPLMPAMHAERLLAITQTFWREWLQFCRYDGPYNESVHRSALVLKLLIYAPTGAIVAAPTTSLPEQPGGERNWDYRFSWLRDSAFVLQALAALGYSKEARAFCDFQRLCCLKTLPSLQIMYGIGGETELPERNLGHLDGYLKSRPVRIGNAAYRQQQIDIYGEILDWALGYWKLGGSTEKTQETMIRNVADYVTAHWQKPDQGLWEMRSEPRHHVHSKIMAWVALDRAIQILGEEPAWLEARDAVLQAVLEKGVDPDGGYLVQAFGDRATDAALLQVPLLGIPIDRAILVRTVEAIERELREGDYVRRYLTDDGLLGSEGAILISSFWLVDALLFLDRADEAHALFERLLTRSNAEGLYAEEIDPATEAFLGNYPQAFTHLALINSAIHLQLYEQGGKDALAGTAADRTRRSTEPVEHVLAVDSTAEKAQYRSGEAELPCFWKENP